MSKIELLNIDCLEYMKSVPDKFFELAIVDPPYGLGIETWDIKPTQDYFKELKRVSKNQIIWGGNYFTDILNPIEGWLCWNKKPFLKNQAHFELAWTSFNIKPVMYEYLYAGNAEGVKNITVNYSKKSIHPCQKPVNIYKMIIQDYAQEGDKILDTHLGSGSSAIAAHQMGFDFVGCEIDKDYFEAAQKRFKEQTMQQSLFKQSAHKCL